MIPILRPSWDEFKDFKKYLTSIDNLGEQYGVVKVIPPPEWLPSGKTEADLQDQLDRVIISSPIRQHFSGSRGVYNSYNIAGKSLTVKEWKVLADGYSQERIHSRRLSGEVTENYFKQLTLINPFYGADVPGSLMTQKEWNIGNLQDGVLSKIAKIKGVNTPYLYFGMWKSTFAWHVEDQDLYSINYIHFGAGKQWFVVPPSHYQQMQKLAAELYPLEFRTCKEFLRHKTCMISPNFLEKHNIPCFQIIQEACEIILTFPQAFHSGYNFGYNCAESTNFALTRWLQLGADADKCLCRPDSVWIDVPTLFGVQKSTIKHKRKPCVLCGSSVDPDMLPIYGQLVQFAHAQCVHWIAETYTDFEDGTLMAFGISDIPRSRWKLKCKFCDYRDGACIQCAKGKCTIAFHVQCAFDNQLYTSSQVVEVQDDNGEMEQVEVPQAFCSAHSPKQVDEVKMKSISDFIRQQNKFTCKWSGAGYQVVLVKDYPKLYKCLVRFDENIEREISYNNVIVK